MDSLDTQPGSSLARLQQHLGTQQTLSTAGAREWTPGASLPPRHSLPPSTSTAPNRFATTATIPEEDIAIDPALDALAPVERNLEPVGRSGLGSESSAGGGGPAVKITRPKAKDGEGKRAASKCPFGRNQCFLFTQANQIVDCGRASRNPQELQARTGPRESKERLPASDTGAPESGESLYLEIFFSEKESSSRYLFLLLSSCEQRKYLEVKVYFSLDSEFLFPA